MAKDWNEKGYWGKYDSLREIGDALGVDHSRYGDEGETTSRPGMPGSRGYETEDYETAVLNAMRNNWDIRESIQAGKNAGNKRFENLSEGINTGEEAYNIWNALEKTHRKDLGNGGQFSSANDFSGVSRYLDNDYQESIAEKYGRNDDDSGSSEPETPSNEVNVPNTPSDFWTNVVEDPYFDRYGEVSPYSKSNNDAATTFKNKYVTDITEGLNIDQRQSLNLKNAMDAVGDSEIKQGHTNYLSKFHDDDD